MTFADRLTIGLAGVALTLIQCGNFTIAYLLLVYGFGVDATPAAAVSVVWALGGTGGKP